MSSLFSGVVALATVNMAAANWLCPPTEVHYDMPYRGEVDDCPQKDKLWGDPRQWYQSKCLPFCKEKKYQKMSLFFRCRWIVGAPHNLGYGCSNCKECIEMNAADQGSRTHDAVPVGMGSRHRMLGMIQAFQNARNAMAKYWAAKLGAGYEEPYKALRGIELHRQKAIVEISKILPATKFVSNLQNKNGAEDDTTGIWTMSYDVVRRLSAEVGDKATYEAATKMFEKHERSYHVQKLGIGNGVWAENYQRGVPAVVGIPGIVDPWASPKGPEPPFRMPKDGFLPPNIHTPFNDALPHPRDVFKESAKGYPKGEAPPPEAPTPDPTAMEVPIPPGTKDKKEKESHPMPDVGLAAAAAPPLTITVLAFLAFVAAVAALGLVVTGYFRRPKIDMAKEVLG